MSDQQAEARSDFSEKPTLLGERVLLRPFHLAEDLDVLRGMLADPQVDRFANGDPGTTPPPPWDEDAERRMRAWYGSRADQPDRLDLAVVDRATGRCVGEVVLNEWEPANRSCNFRIILVEAGRDRGFGTEALRLIVGHGFERLGLHRISLGVFSFNPRARRCYEKAGFVLEGVRRQAHRFGDEWADDLVMAILAPEWEQHRGYPQGR
ncbi:GNAT family N-acetyltransferase [Kitasatospora sp. NPDC008050]|uniref:GNAT family N-acetyltransferase n=1 Tax=Kitasatospora sp. NPDC008050 TaxID=3364021 RepID=UPI0036EE44CB